MCIPQAGRLWTLEISRQVLKKCLFQMCVLSSFAKSWLTFSQASSGCLPCRCGWQGYVLNRLLGRDCYRCSLRCSFSLAGRQDVCHSLWVLMTLFASVLFPLLVTRQCQLEVSCFIQRESHQCCALWFLLSLLGRLTIGVTFYSSEGMTSADPVLLQIFYVPYKISFLVQT